ncbi:hypothetical protein L9F63_013278, partial [Diploptera punctata]
FMIFLFFNFSKTSFDTSLYHIQLYLTHIYKILSPYNRERGLIRKFVGLQEVMKYE